MRRLVGRQVVDRRRIEDDDVGEGAGAEDATVG